jgi:hypothetical protein
MAEDPGLLFLSHLERLEARLLSWGLVDGSFSAVEIQKEAETFLTREQLWESFETEQRFIQNLIDRRFLYAFLQGTAERYRTRMAETVRLLSRLRQLFPKHLERGRLWQTASPLVGDFRFMLRPRSFPNRNVGLNESRQQIESVAKQSPIQKSVLEALLGRDERFRLAKFQQRATETILRNTGQRHSSGTIICAGTGSGKTLAFYLPAFLHLAESIDASFWTRCLAIYPRNELLKDQLSETFRQARRIDTALHQHGKRKLIVGTLFGATPENEWAFNYDEPPRGWQRSVDGFVCPFLQCPNENCDGLLIWKVEDRKAKRHELHCRKCSAHTKHDELILTRERLAKEPPDILFTTTEMLNQRMGDSRFCHVFGVNSDRKQKPSLVLLDEVHTYAGISGAQTALLLRRWKHAASVKPHFVGLSATLADARRFFGTLVGVNNLYVEEVSPHPNDMSRQGMEYLVAARSDPASRASLLSTTIQTAMLMRRTLDTGRQHRSVFGCREFVFTDDLDVTNRLFFNLRDAEGQDSWGRPDLARKPGGSLANLRNSALAEPGLRQRFGQNWELCEQIGHSLATGTAGVIVDRTSSQDAGVAANADIVVATASLEVGFNDPDVNVVVQHKAPRDPAQFLQRKGRAGRRTDMRPWTVVVLSDYGRDRLAWQSYDVLFDPELSPRELPVSNRYVLRMQAVFAFFDWVSEQLRRTSGIAEGSVWRDFSGPAEKLGSRYQHAARNRQSAVASIVDGLLTRDDGYAALLDYLASALEQPPEVIETLLWEPPRAIMTVVLPTLLRRLETQWKRVEGGLDYRVENHPLPEFVPATLFSDLNLPEVTIISPPQQRGDQIREEPLPILQALREFAPGRVSRRFGVKNIHARHWVAPPDWKTIGLQQLPISTFLVRYEDIGEFQFWDDAGNPIGIRCVRPFELQVQVPERQIRDSSNAFLKWKTQIGPATEGLQVDIPRPSRWEAIISDIRFFTHNQHAPLEVRRFAVASHATVVLENGTQTEIDIRFVEITDPDQEASSRRPVGVGFAIDVDGVVIRFCTPDSLVSSITANEAKLRSLRSAKYRDLIAEDERLDEIANSFQRQWLSQVYMSALVVLAIRENCGLQIAWNTSQKDLSRLSFHEVLAVIFQSIPLSNSNEDTDEDSADDMQQQLQRDLTELLDLPTVVEVLTHHAPVLWESVDNAWIPWLTRKFKTTLGAAILDAIQQLCPDLDGGDLHLDIDAGPRPIGTVPAPTEHEELWLTERTVGGGGIVENLLIRYGEDPRRFFDLVEAALMPSDLEVADEQLSLFLEWIADSADVTTRRLVSQVRTAETLSNNAYATAFEELKKHLSAKGLFVCHSVTTAIGARIIRPGSTPETDALLHRLISNWKHREAQLGIEIDARIFAYIHSGDDALDKALNQIGGDALETDRRQWRFGALFSLLWPRGSVVRGQRLAVYNPFADLPAAEHDLVRDCLEGEPTVVSIGRSDWRDEVTAALIRESVVILQAPFAAVQQLRTALLAVMASPIDTEFMLLHPRVRGVERRAGMVRVTLTLAEGNQ